MGKECNRRTSIVSDMYIRLHFVVEGQTEQTFVNNTIKPHLSNYNVGVDVRCVETGRKRHKIYKGGMISYIKFKNDLQRWMRQDDKVDSWFTSMIDLYGLKRIDDEFPGYMQALQINDPYSRVEALEKALFEDISKEIPLCRFIPYIQLHEFEALLLVEPEKLTVEFPDNEKEANQLSDQVKDIDSPERIDDGEQTAPSKRIISLIPRYDGRKPSSGPIIADNIGLPAIRQKCPHFERWIKKLESLSQTANENADNIS